MFIQRPYKRAWLKQKIPKNSFSLLKTMKLLYCIFQLYLEFGKRGRVFTFASKNRKLGMCYSTKQLGIAYEHYLIFCLLVVCKATDRHLYKLFWFFIKSSRSCFFFFTLSLLLLVRHSFLRLVGNLIFVSLLCLIVSVWSRLWKL